MRKEKFCKDLVIGEAFDNEPYRVTALQGISNGQVRVTLSDRTGSVTCIVPESLADAVSLAQHIGDVFSLSAAVIAEKREPLLMTKSIKPCLDNYLPAELFSGLTQEKKDTYITLIKEIRTKIKHAGYLSLANACLTDENLRRLGELPATHGYYGNYLGGALAATCTVTYMVTSSMAAYVNKGNGITTTAPGWNVLLTAALLHAFGRIDYCDATDPFKKSARGVAMNYFSTLQHSIEAVIFENNLQLDDQDIANLLNVLSVGVTNRTDTKAVSKDGTILRHILRLYGECDAIDYQLSNYSAVEGEEYFYSKQLSRYLLTKEVQ